MIKLKNTYKIILPLIVTTVFTTLITGVFGAYFLFQYSLKSEKRLYSNIEEHEEIDIYHLCQEIGCDAFFYNGKYYTFNESDYLDFKQMDNVTIPKEIYKHENISLREDFTFVIPVQPRGHDAVVYFSVNVSKFIPTLMSLYIVLLVFFNISTGIIIHMVLMREKILNNIELSKDKSTLQFDNLMFYIENLNHEVNSPLFILSRKIKELKNKTEGNEKNFEIIFNSIEQISAVMQRTREVKKINKVSEDRTLYDLIESTIATIGVMRSENISSKTDENLRDYYLDQDLISNGTFINILTNHIKNSIEAYADLLISSFVRVRKGKLTFTFTDNGNGILPENRKHIFERGFSTKGDKLVRGSGMSINKIIIESIGGTIKLNNMSEGTQFELTVPVKEKRNK